MMLLKAVLAAAVAGLLIQDPVPDERAQQIRRAIEWLSDSDPEMRDLGRKELLSLGREAVPRLEDLLRAKGALEIYKIVREIELGKNPPASEIPGPMLSDEEFLRRIGRADGTAIDTYIRSKMADIRSRFKDRQYQKAYDMVQALVVLEPKSRYVAELHQMRKVCDNMITQNSIVHARVVPPRGVQ